MDKNESTPQPQLFVSKRVEKWALQFAEDGSNWINVHQFMCVQCPINVPTFYVQIETLEGTMTAKRGDWIVKGPRGECYPVKPDIFALSYELRSVAGGEPTHDLRNCPAMRGLVGLTPGGSEFVDDIERCIQHVRDTERLLRAALVRTKKQQVAGGEPEQWIAVETGQVPADRTWVIACVEHDGQRYVVPVYGIHVTFDDNRWRWESEFPVTHWRALPAPPTREIKPEGR